MANLMNIIKILGFVDWCCNCIWIINMGRIFLVSLVSERCENCRYKGEVLFGELCCDYILITSEKRGCPAGDECDKFEEEN